MERRCYDCKEHKPLAEFRADKSKPRGHSCLCIICERAKSKARYRAGERKTQTYTAEQKERKLARDRAYNSKEEILAKRRARHRTKKYQLKRRARELANYGITEAIYNEMFRAQNGVCAICRKPSLKRLLAIDHCHATGSVRGLLCHSCNPALGMFKDNPLLLARAIEYLRSSGGPQ